MGACCQKKKTKWWHFSRTRLILIDVGDSCHITADIIIPACKKKKSIVSKISKIINWNNFYVRLLILIKMFPKHLQRLSKLFMKLRKLKNYCLKYQSYAWNFQLCVRNCQRKLLANLIFRRKTKGYIKNIRLWVVSLKTSSKASKVDGMLPKE